MTRQTLALWLLLLATLSGCAQLDVKQLWKKPVPTADAQHPVVEMLCLWEPGEGPGLNGIPGRGFAGQILFFASGHRDPARISGNVEIYVFDQLGDDPAKPIQKFEFLGQAMRQYEHDGNLGITYQLFVPYTRLGMHEAECTLRVKFTPEEGGTPVYSRMATVNLPGKQIIADGETPQTAQSQATAIREESIASRQRAIRDSKAVMEASLLTSTRTPQTARDSGVISASYEELADEPDNETTTDNPPNAPRRLPIQNESCQPNRNTVSMDGSAPPDLSRLRSAADRAANDRE